MRLLGPPPSRVHSNEAERRQGTLEEMPHPDMLLLGAQQCYGLRLLRLCLLNGS